MSQNSVILLLRTLYEGVAEQLKIGQLIAQQSFKPGSLLNVVCVQNCSSQEEESGSQLGLIASFRSGETTWTFIFKTERETYKICHVDRVSG